MECYEGATMIKTFRGVIASGEEDTIALHTNDGSTGYRIKKFSIINQSVATKTVELVAKIYTIAGKTSSIFTVDFSDQTLLAVAYYQDNNASTATSTEVIIFDQETFNQDIYIVAAEGTGSNDPINYYLELEQVKLDMMENTVATLKDIRNLEAGIP